MLKRENKIKKSAENKIILKQWVRVFLIVIVTAIMVGSIYTIVKALNPEQITKKKLYSYTYKGDMAYKVYLKPNNFFTTPYMEMNKQYISSIVDYIEVDAKYNFDSTEDLDFAYDYSIVATARGMYEGTDGKKVDVWSKTYPIGQLEQNKGSGKNFSFAKTVKVDYNYYNQVLTDFRNQFGLSIDARVDLTLKLNVTGSLKGTNEQTLNEQKEMTLQMPLMVQAFRIKPDYINSGGDTIYSKVNPNTKPNMTLLIPAAILLIVSLIIFIKLVKSLLVVTRKSEYILAVNKIMKEYADIIAETHNMPDLSKYDIVNIKNFNDMVDIEEELHSPIIYFELEENSKCVFLILAEKTAYRFLLRESDFDHFKSEEEEILDI